MSMVVVQDPERLTAPQQNCRKLTVCLLLVVLVLALALASLGTFVLLHWPCEGNEKTGKIVLPPERSVAAAKAAAAAAAEIAAAARAGSRMEVVAASAAKRGSGTHLIPKEVDVNEKLIPWFCSNNINSVITGPNFLYEQNCSQLQVRRSGLYYLYAQLSVKCVMFPCTQDGTVTLDIQRGTPGTSVLQIPLKLQREEASLFSDTLLCLSTGDQLQARLHLQEVTNYKQWELNQTDYNFWGFLHVSSECME